jgi:hypothetical protein
MIQTPPESGEDTVVLEVHEYLPGLRGGQAARDLRVIAASLAEPGEQQAARPLTWQRVSQVVYRHWATGETFEFRETNMGYLQAIVSAVARGMSGQVIIPRALTGFEACRECAYRQLCWETGWETLPLVDPGTLGLAEQLRDVVRKFCARELRARDEQAAQHALEELELIQTALGRLLPDSIATTALVNEAKHELERVQHESP